MDAPTRRSGGGCGGGQESRRAGRTMTRQAMLALAASLAAFAPLAAAAQNSNPAAKPPGIAPGTAPIQMAPQAAPPAGAGEPDLAFGAFQRGYFLTAFQFATDR